MLKEWRQRRRAKREARARQIEARSARPGEPEFMVVNRCPGMPLSGSITGLSFEGAWAEHDSGVWDGVYDEYGRRLDRQGNPL